MSTNRAPQDILKRFPYEIWSKCLLDAIYRAPEGPLPFLSVSSHWQMTLLGSPEMWSYIHIDDGEDIDARVHVFLVLSGGYPLEVGIAFTKPIWLRMKPIIAAHKERVQAIHALSWPQMGLEHQRIPTLLESITFPAVRTITTVDHTFYISAFEYILDVCPSLEWSEFYIFDGVNKDIRSPPRRLRGVCTRSINHSVELMTSQVQAYLHLQYLEHLDLTISFLLEPNPETLRADNFVLTSTKLRKLVLSATIRPVVQGILGSSLRYLQSLVIAIYPSQFDILINTFPSLCSLQSVHLSVEFETTDTGGFPRLQQSHIPQVKEFTISAGSRLQPSLGAVFDALTDQDALVGVEVFRFTSSYIYESIYVANVTKLLYALRNCTSIELSILKDTEPTTDIHGSIASPIHMPNLLCLDVTCSTPIPPIVAPALQHLNVSYPFLSTTTYPLNHFGRALEGSDITGEIPVKSMLSPFNHWETVQHIQWGSCESFIGQKTITFQHLQSVEFFGFNIEIYDQIHALNAFLISLIRYPGSCPHLRSMKSWINPTWQLFFQVILERNENRGLDRLQEIWLPRLPIPSLLALVVSLLSGKRSVIPRGTDNMIVRRSKHQLVTACRQCVGAGYIQCPIYDHTSQEDPLEPWWQEKENGSMHDGRSDADYLELLQLPSDLQPTSAADSNFASSWNEWEERLNQMTADCKTKGPLGRWTCGRGAGQLERIHKLILHG